MARLKTTGYYMNNRNGNWKWYDEKGKLVLEINYLNCNKRL